MGPADGILPIWPAPRGGSELKMSFDQHGGTAEFRLELLDLQAHDEGTVVLHAKNTLRQGGGAGPQDR
jgi:hypothetical protein